MKYESKKIVYEIHENFFKFSKVNKSFFAFAIRAQIFRKRNFEKK